MSGNEISVTRPRLKLVPRQLGTSLGNTSTLRFALEMAKQRQSNWRLEDLHELEQYGLAADLESTNITGLGQSQDFEAFNMRYTPL